MFFATTRKKIRHLKPRQLENLEFFCHKAVYRDSKLYIGIPLLVLLSLDVP